MSRSPLIALREKLLAMKKKAKTVADRIELSELLDHVDELERRAPREVLEEWIAKHAKDLDPTPRDEKILRFFLSGAEVTEASLSALLADKVTGDRATPTASRRAICDLKARLKAVSSVTIEKTCRGGEYRTHDVSIQTLKNF